MPTILTDSSVNINRIFIRKVIGEEYELLSEKIEDGQHELVLQRLVACPTNALLRRLLDKTDIISYQRSYRE